VHSINGTAVLIVPQYFHYSKENENQLGVNSDNTKSDGRKLASNL
jgi:hypothetical protein